MLTLPLLGDGRRQAALALTLVMHMLLFVAWHLSNRISVDTDTDSGSRIQWLLTPKPAPLEVPLPPVLKNAAAAPSSPRPVAPVASVSLQAAVSPAPADAAADAEPLPTPGMSLMDRARGAVGEIDRGLLEANKRKLIRAKPVTTQMRLERAMQNAHDMAPNRWYEAPKVTEIIDPGGYGRRRYRVVGANGTYCITIESNHAPDGIDTMQHGIKPKLTNCPPDEQPATKQEW